MRPKLKRSLLFALAFCANTEFIQNRAIAQDANDTTSSDSSSKVPNSGYLGRDIVVRGRSNDNIRNFVAQMTQRGPTNQIGRWKDDICPVFSGLSNDQTATIAQRMAATWQAVGLSAPPRHCDASLVVIFTNEAGYVATDLAKRYPMTLRADGRWLLRRFVKSDRPVRWLTISNQCGFGCSSGSNIFMETAPAFSAMLIIIDGKKIAGITLEEMADYLAVVSLSNPPNNASAPQDSILSLFDSSPDVAMPRSITDSDREFLSSLYHAPTHLPMSLQRAEMARRIKRAEEKKHAP